MIIYHRHIVSGFIIIRNRLLTFDGGKPEAELVGEIVARPSGAVALDEWRGSEVFEAAARAGQRLATTFGTRGSVLLEMRERINNSSHFSFAKK